MADHEAFIDWIPNGGTSTTLKFDAVITEQQEGTAEITEQPVEKGANITDHVRAKLDHVTLEVVMSNTPVKDVNGRGQSKQSLPIDVPSFTSPSTLLSSISTANIRGRAPMPTSVSAFTFGTEFDAVAETKATLDTLRTSAQLVNVSTSTSEYKDMVIESVTLTRDATTGGSGRFQISFKQIRLVEVQLVTAPAPTETRAKKAVKKGPQGPTEPPAQKESLLRAGIQKLPIGSLLKGGI